MATEETLRSTVGRDADVPSRRMLSDMGVEYSPRLDPFLRAPVERALAPFGGSSLCGTFSSRPAPQAESQRIGTASSLQSDTTGFGPAGPLQRRRSPSEGSGAERRG